MISVLRRRFYLLQRAESGQALGTREAIALLDNLSAGANSLCDDIFDQFLVFNGALQ